MYICVYTFICVYVYVCLCMWLADHTTWLPVHATAVPAQTSHHLRDLSVQIRQARIRTIIQGRIPVQACLCLGAQTSLHM
jgi:hypothetical protein